MNDEFTISSKISRKEFKTYAYSFVYRRLFYKLMTAFGLLILVAGVVSSNGLISFFSDFTAFPIFVGLFLLLFPVVAAARSVVNYDKSPRAAQLHYYTINIEGIKISSDNVETVISWPFWIGIRTENNMVILYETKKKGVLINKNAISDDQINFIRSRIRENRT